MKGAIPKIDTQITRLRPMRSPIGSAEQRAERHRQQKDEQVDLRGAHRNMKFLDQIEAVVAGDAGDVEVFREDQHHQNARSTSATRAPRQQRDRARRAGDGARPVDMLALVPGADARQHRDGEQRGEREPGETGSGPAE